jgi:hypothetical protein
MQTIAEDATVFRAHPRRLPDAKPAAGDVHHEGTARQDAEPASAGISRQLQAVVAWIESEPAAPRVDVRQVNVRWPDAPADTRPVERGTIGGAAGPASGAPQPVRPDRARALEAPVHAAPAIPAPTASAMREASVRERLSPPTAADREPRGSRLTVNHLNLQIVNEDRSTRKEPPHPRTPSPPREAWGRFERRHLRVP